MRGGFNIDLPLSTEWVGCKIIAMESVGLR
jgi:hypothetical protein